MGGDVDCSASNDDGIVQYDSSLRTFKTRSVPLHMNDKVKSITAARRRIYT